MTDQESSYEIGKYPPVNHNDFILSRASAIQSYANVEQSLCGLFAGLLEIKDDLAGIVFYRVANARFRNRILEELLEKRVGNANSIFWNSLESFLRRLDQRRNEIVHWHIVQNIDLSKLHPEAANWSLRPPAGWMNGSPASLNEKEMIEFIQQCEFISRLINMFSMIMIREVLPPAERQPWLEIFRQPILYPPPEGHPLSPNPKAPLSPPQPSGE